MKRRIFAPCLALILLLAASPVTNAQDWQGLRGLKQGKQIWIEFKTGRDPIEGKFISAVGTELTVSQDGFHFTMRQSDVQRVYRLKGKWSRNRTAKIGLAVGMLVGTFISVHRSIQQERSGTVPSNSDGTPSFAGFVYGSMVGAGLGALVGGKRKGKLLYEAK
jgi:hypothetical protein